MNENWFGGFKKGGGGGVDKSIIQQYLQIIGEMQPKLFGGLFPHPSQVCYYWHQVVEKAKEQNLMTEDWICVMQKFGGTKH